MDGRERKVIQLMKAGDYGLFALCDDGTMWMNERPYYPKGQVGCDWFQVRPIPQEPKSVPLSPLGEEEKEPALD